MTESDREKETKSNSEYNTIINNDIDANTIQSIERYDGNNKLMWPIARSKKVNRIVIHHTSEEFKQDSDDDAKLIRAIYLYHARTR